jgi:hypothetical protein
MVKLRLLRHSGGQVCALSRAHHSDVVATRDWGSSSKDQDRQRSGDGRRYRELVGAQPNIKVAEIHASLGERGVTTSQTAVSNALTRFGIRPANSGRAGHAADVQAMSKNQQP